MAVNPQQLERMRQAIEALPEPTQSVYRRHLMSGVDYRAIAEELGIRVSDVERHVARAIVLIDRMLRSAN